MKKLLMPAFFFSVLFASGQNPDSTNQIQPQQINPPPQFVQNANVQNDLGNLSNYNQNVDEEQNKQKININAADVFGTDNPDQGYNPPKRTYGQSIHVSSGGYSGSSGFSSVKSHKAKKSFSIKFKKVMKIFDHKYKAPKHYGHKSRIRKCQRF